MFSPTAKNGRSFAKANIRGLRRLLRTNPRRDDGVTRNAAAAVTVRRVWSVADTLQRQAPGVSGVKRTFHTGGPVAIHCSSPPFRLRPKGWSRKPLTRMILPWGDV